MSNHFEDAGVVANDESVEAPLVAEHVGEQPAVAGCGNTVDDVERSHNALRTGFDGSLIGGEIVVIHTPMTHVDRVVVATCFRSSVEGEVFYAGENFVIVFEITLITANHSFSDASAQIRVFAVAFGNTSPTSVVAHVEHRAECPVDAVGATFACCYTCRQFYGFHIPRARKCQRYGEYCLVAVNYVHTEQ